MSIQSDISSAPLRRGDPLASPGRQVVVAILATSSFVIAWYFAPIPLLPLMVPIAIIALLLTLSRPAIVSILFLCLTYFKINELSPVLSPLSYLLTAGSALTTVALVWHLIFAQSIQLDFRGPHALIAVFWLIVSAGFVTAQDHTLAYQAWSDYSKTLLLSVTVLWLVRTEAQIRLLVCSFVIGGSIISVNTIANAWSGIGLVEGTRAVAGDGTLSNPNDLALILLLPLSLSIVMVLTKGRSWGRALGSGGTVLITYAIILTQSRGGLLGILAVLFVIGGRYVKSKILLCGLGAVFAMVLYTGMGIADRESGGANDVKGESAQDRIYAWHAGMNMAKTFPLNGVGIGNFTTQFSTYSPEEVQHPITAHSIWFLVLGEIGFPGLAVFCAAIIASIRTGSKTIAELASINAPAEMQGFALATLAGFAGYLVSGSFLSYAYQWPLYVLVALTVALARLAGISTTSCHATHAA